MADHGGPATVLVKIPKTTAEATMGSHGKPDSEDQGQGTPAEHDGQKGPTHGGGGEKTGDGK